ncbi:MAG TPA: hypothetical protein VEP72_08960 [Microbacterium sp.]|nr:hypothetical protein [Microbacterium sp.]
MEGIPSPTEEVFVMRARRAAVLSLSALAALALAGCSAGGSAEPTPTASVAASSYEAPAAAGDRVGVDGLDLQVWSATAPDDAAAATVGDPADGSQWVTVNLAQWTSADGQSDVDVAPVLRSTADDSFTADAVSPRAVEVPMTAGKTYTYAWSFEVPEDLVDGAQLVVCTSADDDAACSLIAK